MPEAPKAPAGWYTDPDDPNRIRYFDGNEWQQSLEKAAPPAPPAAPTPPPTPAAPQGPPTSAPSQQKPAAAPPKLTPGSTTETPAWMAATAKTIGRGINTSVTATKKAGQKFGATPKRTKIIAGVSAAALILLIVGTSIAVPAIQNAAAEAQAQEEHDREVAAEQKAEKIKKAERDQLAAIELERAQEDAGTAMTAGKKYLENAPAWAEKELLAEVQDAYDNLDGVKDSATDAVDIVIARQRLDDSIKDIGTQKDADARAAARAAIQTDVDFVAAAKAAGLSWVGGDATGIRTSKEFCTEQLAAAPAAQLITLRAATVAQKLAVKFYCPQMQTPLDQSAFTFSDGDHVAGAGPDGKQTIATGTYQTLGGVADCYWERHTGNGDIIDNDFVGSAPDGVRVTLNEGEWLTTQRCGVWVKVG